MLILTTPHLTNRSIGKFVDAPEIDCVRGNSNGWMVMVAQGRGGQRLRIRPAKLFQHCVLDILEPAKYYFADFLRAPHFR